MKNLFVLSVMISAAFASQAKTSFADSKPVVITRPDCIVDANDPYDTGQLMERGPFKGMCMDQTLHRPVVILSEDDSSINVANFWHAGHFWIAKIPKQGVDQLIFQIASFKESIPFIKFDHTQLRFIMKPGVTVKLTPQDKDSTLADTELSDFGLIDQVTNPPAPNNVYSPVKGLRSAYGNVIRLADANDRATEEMIVDPNDKSTISNKFTVVRQFLLNMSDDDKDKVLLNGIRLSDRLGYGDIYKLFAENCTTVIFNVLDESLTYDHKVRKFKIHFWNILDPIGGPSIRGLDKRGIVEKELPTWNEELHVVNGVVTPAEAQAPAPQAAPLADDDQKQ